MRKATTPRITRAPSKPTMIPKPPATGTGALTPKPTTTTRPATKPKLISRPKPKATPAPKPITTPVVGPPIVVTLPTPVADNGPLHQIPPESPAPPTALVAPPLIITVTQSDPIPAPAPDKPSIVEWSLGGTEKLPTTDGAISNGVNLDTAQPTPEKPTVAVIEWTSHDPAPQPKDGVFAGNVTLDTAMPVSPAPATSDTILVSSGDKKAGYAVVESEQAKPGYMVVESEKVPPGYIVVESDSQPPATAQAPAESSAIGLPLADAVPLGYAVMESDSKPQTAPAPSVPMLTIPPNHAIEDVSSIQVGDVIIVAIKLLPKTDMGVMP